jgi:hypothetical protein
MYRLACCTGFVVVHTGALTGSRGEIPKLEKKKKRTHIDVVYHLHLSYAYT